MTAEIEGRTLQTIYPVQTATTGNRTGDHITCKNGFFIVMLLLVVLVVMGGLQVVGAGAIAVELQASKHATYACRLNDGEVVDCKQ